jgi:hypothetical protein
MKIKSASGFNFAGYSTVMVNFDKNITYLIGRNGSGKSKLGLDLIWFVFQGIASKASDGKIPLIGDRFRFIGDEGATALGEVVLYDEVKRHDIRVIRKLTKDGTELSFSAPIGMHLDQQWLNNLFNLFLIAPRKFMELTSKEQALVLGINTSEWDTNIQEYKSNHTALNRELKAFGNIEEVEQVEAVDFSALSKQKDDILAFNEEQIKLGAAIVEQQNKITRQESAINQKLAEIERLQEEIKKTRNDIELDKIVLGELPKPQDPKSLAEVQELIDNSTETNRKATLYTEYKKRSEEKEAKEKAIAENNKLIEEQKEKRLEYIKQFKFPFSKLAVDEDGGLLLDDKPLKTAYFSSGELIRIIPSLIASQNPELKYVFIQEANLLDEENLAKIEKELTEQGFQLVIEMVGKEKIEDKNCILLRDCKVVDEYPVKKVAAEFPQLAV